MRELEKLLRKISKKDQLALREEIGLLVQKKHQLLNIKKLQGSDFYRSRKGNFRIIFHYDKKSEVIIDAVRLKGEDIYKDFI
ncbi:MAG: type II toxin-antitoxin system RelE/ParE family toxin [Candidatus Yonathbacteria bacterium]|nr:type II toxin-antitoxin system RelE/ParE family toxin [Candidatus Yonathbacteria bacterium]